MCRCPSGRGTGPSRACSRGAWGRAPLHGLHQVEAALAYAHLAGARPGPAAFPLAIPEEIEDGLAHWRAQHRIPDRYVVMHAGHGGSSPAWPLGHFLRLAALLEAEGLPVVLSLGPADRAVWTALDRAELAIRRLPRLTAELPVLAGLLRRAAVLVGNTSGPVHLAAALATPTLAFHPAGAPLRARPLRALRRERLGARGRRRAARLVARPRASRGHVPPGRDLAGGGAGMRAGVVGGAGAEVGVRRGQALALCTLPPRQSAKCKCLTPSDYPSHAATNCCGSPSTCRTRPAMKSARSSSVCGCW